MDVSSTNHQQESVFVASTQVVDLNQQQGICHDYSKYCYNDRQCSRELEEECVRGYCKGLQWCTPDDPFT